MKKLLFIVVFILGCYSNYAQEYKKHLILYYPFDEKNCLDYSGNNYHGKPINKPSYIDDGIIGSAIHFEGKGYQINSDNDSNKIGSHVLMPMIDLSKFSSFTISLWVRFQDFSHWYSGEAYIFFGHHNAGWLGIMNHIFEYAHDYKLRYSFTSGSEWWNQVINTFYPESDRNRWVHFAMTYEKGVLKAYIDGKQVGTIQQNIKISENKAALARHWWFYEGFSRSSARFTGDIDEVMIFSKALSDEDIKDLATPCKKPDATILSDGNYFCDGDTVTLSISKIYKNILWSTGETTQSIKVTKSCNYFVTFWDVDTCKGFAEIQITFVPITFSLSTLDGDKFVSFDSVGYSNTKCREIKIKNLTNEIQKIDDPILMYNLVYSIPQSQLPIILNAGEERSLLVCFNPNQLGYLKDTIIFLQRCANSRIPLQGIGAPNIYNSNTKCDVRLQGNTSEIYRGGYLGIDTKYYESNKSLKIAIFTNIFGLVDYKLDIYNYLGQLCYSETKPIFIAKGNDGGNIYDFSIPGLDLSQGTYLLTLNISNLSHSSKFTILQ